VPFGQFPVESDAKDRINRGNSHVYVADTKLFCFLDGGPFFKITVNLAEGLADGFGAFSGHTLGIVFSEVVMAPWFVPLSPDFVPDLPLESVISDYFSTKKANREVLAQFFIESMMMLASSSETPSILISL